MKKTMNKFQEAYIIAKSRVKAIESHQDDIEKKYISDKGIVNLDGSVPDHLWCMDDDDAFEKANEECGALIIAAGLESELKEARAALKSAEDRLISYGISLAPIGVRETLERAVQQNALTREKVLDLAFRLDASTVPG